MAHQSRRSESTVRGGDASGRSSLCSEKREDFTTAGDEEKRIGGGLLGDRLPLGADGCEIEEDVEAITRSPTADSARPGLSVTQTNAKSLRSIRSHHSRAGADGYTLNDEDEKPNNSSGSTGGSASADPYLVRWEGGDADPMNPRSMTTLRRWCIVLIVSASSLCVLWSTCMNQLGWTGQLDYAKMAA
ncbi:uncharacterized protein N0V89_009034 [Didymosphaeria variabile]|uniref:Uncharacterized protein n=1 Tax=Didymosphaeria variabile TaxID=1932322 RepID=A0A9W8XHK4_9PLEO|nr:uncharacterized protein N0V89_009034 [Didymosphaeria variabile]KAJ4350413.1 hypothetical protein N0V89_009034 [Didymosphaeria variabile]